MDYPATYVSYAAVQDNHGCNSQPVSTCKTRPWAKTLLLIASLQAATGNKEEADLNFRNGIGFFYE